MRMHFARAFGLVELMIVVVILAILMIAAAPNVSSWLQNSRTRSVAESVQNGLRFAQTEAARLSRVTTFASTATGWTVNYIPADPADAAAIGANPLQSSPAGGLDGAVIASSVTAPTVLAFNSFGRVLTAASATGPLNNAPIAGDATINITNANGPRRLRIVISQSGKTRMCDPDKTFDLLTTPDGC